MKWISPTQHRDPQGEWAEQEYTDAYFPEFAYDGSLETMAMAKVLTPEGNFEVYGDYWSGWLELYPERPINCSKVRLNYMKSNHYGRTEIEVKFNDVWVSVYCALPAIHTPYWHDIDIPNGYGSLVRGLRIRFERPQNLSGKQICFDVYDADFYGELTDLPKINPPADTWDDPIPQDKVEIVDIYWQDPKYHNIWRPLEKLGSGQGLVKTMVSWQNKTNDEIKGYVSVYVITADGQHIDLECLQGNDRVTQPTEALTVQFELPIVGIAPQMQGEWTYNASVEAGNFTDAKSVSFTVGTPYTPPDPEPPPEPQPPQDVAVWEITKGYTPHHLPDAFEGEVALNNLTNIPNEVQGVYCYFAEDNETWFWGNGAPGATLLGLHGGLYADYMVSATGDCTWEIPLGVLNL